MGEIIQLSGDQRTNVNSFLVDQEIAPEVAGRDSRPTFASWLCRGDGVAVC